MQKLLLVMQNEMRASLRRRSFIFFAFGLPILLGVIALVVGIINRDAAPAAPEEAATAEPNQAQGYVDSGGLITMWPDNASPDQLRAYPTETAAQAALAADEIGGYFVISPDYVTTGELRYVTLSHNPFNDYVDVNALAWVLNVNLLGNAALAATAWQPLDVTYTALETAVPDYDDSPLVDMLPTLMTLLIYMIVLMPAGMLVNAVTDEKKNRVLEQLMTSISSLQFITGKFLALAVLGLLQTLVWVGLFWSVLRFGGQALRIPAGFEVPTATLVWAIVYGLLGYGIYGVLMAGLGALAPDVKDTRGVSLIVMSPLIIVYMFMFITFERPDSLFALVMSLFPLTSPVGMISRMAVTSVPLWQALLAAVLQLITAVFLLRIVARLFRAKYLLSGQPLNLGRYVNALMGRA